MAEECDAGAYQRISEPQVAWGRRVVERIPLRGDEHVLDAGCGTGRVTRMIAERVPRGTVEAVDGSAQMVQEARRQLADLGPRVTVRQSDLLELVVATPVDLVVSTATFHWITDHERLFARVFAALAPEGRLVAQCGGVGNIARTTRMADEVATQEPFAGPLEGMSNDLLFADHVSTVTRLREAGFEDATAWLEEAPAYFDDLQVCARFLATVVLRRHVALLGPDAGLAFSQEVARRLREPDGRMVIDYVRLNMQARRPPDAAGARTA